MQKSNWNKNYERELFLAPWAWPIIQFLTCKTEKYIIIAYGVTSEAIKEIVKNYANSGYKIEWKPQLPFAFLYIDAGCLPGDQLLNSSYLPMNCKKCHSQFTIL